MLSIFLISLSLLITSSQSASWAGSWLVNKPSENTCCIPYDDTIIHFKPNPNNASESIVVGAFDAGAIAPCAYLGWQAGIELVWPFSVDNFTFIPTTYANATGYKFTIFAKQHEDGTQQAYIITDQSHWGGERHCVLGIGPIDEAWAGAWKVSQSCNNDDYCCCPEVGKVLNFQPSSSNSSEMQVAGDFPDNPVCKALGWSKSAVFPWGVNQFDPDPKDHLEFFDKFGVSYNVSLYDDQELDFTAYINMNQFSVGGAAQCNLTLFQQTIHREKK